MICDVNNLTLISINDKCKSYGLLMKFPLKLSLLGSNYPSMHAKRANIPIANLKLIFEDANEGKFPCKCFFKSGVIFQSKVIAALAGIAGSLQNGSHILPSVCPHPAIPVLWRRPLTRIKTEMAMR